MSTHPDPSNLIVGQLAACARWDGEMGPHGWQAGYGAIGKWILHAVITGDQEALRKAADPLRDAIAATPEDSHEQRVGWLSALLALVRVADELPALPLVEARTFLASVASAEPQGTVEQSEWMIAQAREGLRRCGGHDFDAEDGHAA